jgi:amidase
MGADAMRFLTLARSQTPHPTVESIATTHIERNRVMRAWSMWHQKHEFLLAPVWTQPPFAHSADIVDEASALGTLDMLRPVMPSNLMGTPAVVIPGGSADGSPTGVQIMGWRNSDGRCLALAAQAQDILGVPQAIDPTW